MELDEPLEDDPPDDDPPPGKRPPVVPEDDPPEEEDDVDELLDAHGVGSVMGRAVPSAPVVSTSSEILPPFALQDCSQLVPALTQMPSVQGASKIWPVSWPVASLQKHSTWQLPLRTLSGRHESIVSPRVYIRVPSAASSVHDGPADDDDEQPASINRPNATAVDPLDMAAL